MPTERAALPRQVSYTFGAPGVGAYLDGRAMLLEPLLLVGAFAALFAVLVAGAAFSRLEIGGDPSPPRMPPKPAEEKEKGAEAGGQAGAGETANPAGE